MTRHMRPKLITPDTIKAVDREYRDLVMSLRALAALLHDVDPEPDSDTDQAWEPVLANILDAELSQLSVLMGDVTAALRMENDVAGPRRRVDLNRALESANRKTGSRALIKLSEPVRVEAHPEIVAQACLSALSLAFRIAEGRIAAYATRVGGEGVVCISIPTNEEHPWMRWESRFGLLRKIVAADGGRVQLEHRTSVRCVRLSFRTAPEASVRIASSARSS